MKFNLHCIFLVYLAVLYSVQAGGQDLTNKGKDFWIGYGNHIRMFNPGTPEKMQLYITSDINTTGEVTISSIGFNQRYTVQAHEISIIDIPRTAALLDDGLYAHGIHVTSVQPVVVYSFIYVNSISGATVCLPTNTLGNDYYSVNADQVSNEPNASSYFFVIAADTGITTVEITPAAVTKSGRQAGVPFVITLTQGQVYQVLGAVTGNDGVDLTGSRIRSMNSGNGCKRIAVFSGSGKVAIGCAFRSSDNLYQQMYPTTTWGRKYITVPGIINSNNLFRIVKSDPAAKVSLNGVPVADNLFINNFYYQFTSKDPNVIESDRPILVVQYLPTQGCLGNPNPGDPEMIFLNPVEQTIGNVTLNSLQPALGSDITLHFLNVVLKNNAAAINTFKIDGVPYTDFLPVASDNNYAYARITTTKGAHTITCDTGFNIIAYGFGNAESYGYSGGTHLKDLYQYASVKNQYALVNFPATCVDAPFSFNMTFPYEPVSIEWKFNGLFPDELVSAPAADSSWLVNGKKLYFYKLNKLFTGPPAGVYPIKIIAHNPTPDGCTGIQEISYDLNVYAKPAADFTFATKGCKSDTVYFEDTSPQTTPVIKWIWNFEDGAVRYGKTANYLFSKAGNHTVALDYISEIGCVATKTATVHINASPAPDFQTSALTCENRDIIFTDKSIIDTGYIAGWSWTMGDGKEWTKANNEPFTDRYNKTGTYTVTLQTVSDKGCTTSVAKNIMVHAKPAAGFILPSDCAVDPVYQFRDTSSIADGTTDLLKYNWRFGDHNSNAGNPDFSNQKSPGHKYTSAGSYLVALKITSSSGCDDSVLQTLQLKAAAPNADFIIKEGAAVCSDQSLTFVDQSTIAFGKVSKVEIFWDYNNDPTNKSIYDNPTQNAVYDKPVAVFHVPGTKDQLIHMVAYANESCLSSVSKTITLKAVPDIHFDLVKQVCENLAPFKFTDAGEINNMPGTGAFSGAGVSSIGLFNPEAAGTGQHTLRYTYRAFNNCTAFLDKEITVLPISVNAGPDRYLPAGEQVVLPATANGKNIVYEWTPPIGLDRPDIAQPLASPPDETNYILTVTTEDGCRATDSVRIKVLKPPLIPNAFSPNGDGINDVWMISHLTAYPSPAVQVYNRYGQLVFESKGYHKPWDGTKNGTPLPFGTYYYVITPNFSNKQLTGSITIVR